MGSTSQADCPRCREESSSQLAGRWSRRTASEIFIVTRQSIDNVLTDLLGVILINRSVLQHTDFDQSFAVIVVVVVVVVLHVLVLVLILIRCILIVSIIRYARFFCRFALK
jgi:uncharacterized membrane protein YdbT with pleckstrin-like domain